MRIVEQANGRVEVRVFDGLGGHCAYGRIPRPTASIPLTLHNFKAAAEREFEAYDNAVANARQDKSLSALGVRERSREQRQRAADALGRLFHNTKHHVEDLQAKRAALFAVPQLDPGDVAGATYDREIRDGFGQLSDHQRANELAKPRVRDALLRSPFTTNAQQQAQGMWQAHIETEHADDLAHLDAQIDNGAWLQSVHQALQGVLDRTEAEFGEPKQTAQDLADVARAEQQKLPSPTPAATPVDTTLADQQTAWTKGMERGRELQRATLARLEGKGH